MSDDEKAKGVEMLAQWLAARHRHRASEVELVEASVAMARGLRRFADKISPPPVEVHTGNVGQLRPRGAQ